MKLSEEHEALIEAGLRLHEARDYGKALPFFKKAVAATPRCAVAQYNLANTLHMLGRHVEAATILRKLITTPDSTLHAGCPLRENPRSFKVDALYLLFLATLFDTEKWDAAFPFAERHLTARRRGLRSAWTVKAIRAEILELKSYYSRP